MPGAGKTIGFLFATGACDAALIVGQAVGLSKAIVNCWNAAGGGVAAEVAAGADAASRAIDPWFSAAAGFSDVLMAQLGWIILFLACFIGRQLVKFFRERSMDGYARTQASSLRRQISQHLIAAGPSAVHRHGAGTITTMLAEGISRTQEYIGLMLPKVADLMVIPGVLSIALFAIDWVSGIIAVVMLPFIFWENV